jgi:hypothetical protein
VCQPNWFGPEVLILIVAEEQEQEVQKLSNDTRDLMETANQKKTKIADATAKTGCFMYPRGTGACRDK